MGMISDIAASDSNELSAAMGIQAALAGAGFFIGAIGAGQISRFGLSVNYGLSAAVSCISFLLIGYGF